MAEAACSSSRRPLVSSTRERSASQWTNTRSASSLSQLPFVMFNLGPKSRPRRSSSLQRPTYMGAREVDTLLCKRGSCVLGTQRQDPEKPERLGRWAKFAEKGLSGPPHNRAGLEFLLALRSRTRQALCACERCLEAVACCRSPRIQKLSRPSCPPAACDLLPGGHSKAAGSAAVLLLHSSSGAQGPEERRVGLTERL